ncbi:MAG: ArsR/SmtB family transcription factor [Solirubrobacterales bacterium]
MADETQLAGADGGQDAEERWAPSPLSDGLIERVVALLTGLGQPVRLRIVEVLSEGAVSTPNEIADRLGLTQQNVSKHLRTMAQAGLVARTRSGSNALYSVKDRSVLDIVRLAAELAVHEIEDMASAAFRREDNKVARDGE